MSTHWVQKQPQSQNSKVFAVFTAVFTAALLYQLLHFFIAVIAGFLNYNNYYKRTAASSIQKNCCKNCYNWKNSSKSRYKIEWRKPVTLRYFSNSLTEGLPPFFSLIIQQHSDVSESCQYFFERARALNTIKSVFRTLKTL